ncbi:MAG: hypothetical protein WCP31_02435, partial [Chloroflexales bacterium]
PTPTFTPTPTPTITPTPTFTPTTPTTTPASVGEADYLGICLTGNTDVSFKGFQPSKIGNRYYEFPAFTNWCSAKIEDIYTASTEPATMTVNLANYGDVKSLFLMATISESGVYDPQNPVTVAIVTYIYEHGETAQKTIVPGRNIAHWDYDLSPLRVNQGTAYRIWSGLSKDYVKAAQVLVIVLDPAHPDNGERDLNRNKLKGIVITRPESTTSVFMLDLYGLAVSKQPITETSSPANSKPICLAPNAPNASVEVLGDYGRIQDYPVVIDTMRDYYAQRNNPCKPESQIPFVDDLPDNLLDPSWINNRPQDKPSIRTRFILGPHIYESRPVTKGSPADYPEGVEPKITITLTTSEQLAWVHLALSARNVCSGGRLKLGNIQIYDNENKPVLDPPIDLIVGTNIRQGRTGTTECKIPFKTGKDARLLGVHPSSDIPGIPLAAKPSIDTHDEPVALWVDVISIQIPLEVGAIKRIVLTDTTRPERNESGGDPDDSRDTVDFTDPYLVLYGVTIEPRPPESRPPPPPPAEPER